MNKSRMRDSVEQVERVTAECEGVRRELREVKKREEALKKERDQAVSENRAIQYQVSADLTLFVNGIVDCEC